MCLLLILEKVKAEDEMNVSVITIKSFYRTGYLFCILMTILRSIVKQIKLKCANKSSVSSPGPRNKVLFVPLVENEYRGIVG